ncbi:MAG: penicillin-binding protein activator [Bdellovibrionota bacterium]|nr:MAG: penicillin-binding protein activator [Bdellovibrionota bacterium]
MISRTTAIILSLIVLAVTRVSVGEDSKSLKVAALLGLTGGAAYHSAGIRKGIELAAEDLKARGWQIDLRYEDDQTNPTKTVSAMQFLSSQGYKSFIGPTWSFQVNAVREIVANNDLVAMVPAGSSEINGGAAQGVFNLCPSRTQQVPYLVEWLKRQGYHRGFIVTPNGDWGEIHRRVFARAVKDAGGSVVGEEQFDYGIDISSLRTILLKGAQVNADVVFTTGAGDDVANVVRARNALHLSFSILSTADIRDALALKLVSHADVQQDVFAIGLTVSSDFKMRYMARFGEQPSLYSDRGYDALMILAEATERTDGSQNAVRSFLNSGVEFSGVSGKIKFDNRGDVGAGDYQVFKAAL